MFVKRILFQQNVVTNQTQTILLWKFKIIPYYNSDNASRSNRNHNKLRSQPQP